MNITALRIMDIVCNEPSPQKPVNNNREIDRARSQLGAPW